MPSVRRNIRVAACSGKIRAGSLPITGVARTISLFAKVALTRSGDVIDSSQEDILSATKSAE